jgi:hypothetical protein
LEHLLFPVDLVFLFHLNFSFSSLPFLLLRPLPYTAHYSVMFRPSFIQYGHMISALNFIPFLLLIKGYFIYHAIFPFSMKRS